MTQPNSAAASFQLPPFFDYPPYFTLQPVAETRERQLQLWRNLLLAYCRHHHIFLINLNDFALFSNPKIQRHLNRAAREAIVASLVASGRAEWTDRKDHRSCLVLWRSIEEWASVIQNFVQENGFGDTVLTLAEIREGDDTKDTELHGIDMNVLIRALKILEQQGKASVFKGDVGDDDGVKFFL